MSVLSQVRGWRPTLATPLPYVPSARPDELVSSWIERTALWYGSSLEVFLGKAAHATGYDLSCIEPDVHLPTGMRSYLAVQLGVAPAQLDAMMLWHELDVLAGDRITFCYRCWDEDAEHNEVPYVRRAWRGAWTLRCSSHSQWLCDRVSPCGGGCEQLWREDRVWARWSRVPFEPGTWHLLREHVANPDEVTQYLRMVIDDVEQWRNGLADDGQREAPFDVFRNIIAMVSTPVLGRMSLVSRTLGQLTTRESKDLRGCAPRGYPVGSIEERAVTLFVAHSLWSVLRGCKEQRNPLGKWWRTYLHNYFATSPGWTNIYVQHWPAHCREMWCAFLARRFR